MPYVGEFSLDENWTNLVTEATPDLAVGTKYRIINLGTRALEYIRLEDSPGNALKGHGVPLGAGGERELTIEANVGLWIRGTGGSSLGLVVVETA